MPPAAAPIASAAVAAGVLTTDERTTLSTIATVNSQTVLHTTCRLTTGARGVTRNWVND